MNSSENRSKENRRLREAVQSVEVPPFLDAKIRARIQHDAAPRRPWRLAVPAAAVAGLAIAAGLLVDTRRGAENQESFIATVSAKVSTLMRVGLGDHLHCAFFRKFPAEAPAAEEMESELGPEYEDLLPAVRRNIPEEYKLVLGHQCRYNGRSFVHLSLKGDGRLLSIVITAKQEGETFDIAGALPSIVQSGIPMYAESTGQFQIAAMETSGHLVYFISDLPARENSRLMLTMAPAVKTILENRRG